jgi:hypothetical protein
MRAVFSPCNKGEPAPTENTSGKGDRHATPERTLLSDNSTALGSFAESRPGLSNGRYTILGKPSIGQSGTSAYYLEHMRGAAKVIPLLHANIMVFHRTSGCCGTISNCLGRYDIRHTNGWYVAARMESLHRFRLPYSFYLTFDDVRCTLKKRSSPFNGLVISFFSNSRRSRS